MNATAGQAPDAGDRERPRFAREIFRRVAGLALWSRPGPTDALLFERVADLLERGEEELGWRPGEAAGVHFLGRGVIQVDAGPPYIVVETLTPVSHEGAQDISLGFQIDNRAASEPPPRFDAERTSPTTELMPLRLGEVQYSGRELFFYPLRSDLSIEKNLVELADFIRLQYKSEEPVVDIGLSPSDRAARERQRINLERLLRRFDPSSEMELILLSHPGIVREHFATLRPLINPWINLYEVIAVAWLHGWVAQGDIGSLKEKAKAEKGKATVLTGNYVDRERLNRFRELSAGQSGFEPSPAPDSLRFRTFVERHWSFRRGISRALFGLHHQLDVVGGLCPQGEFTEIALANGWLQSPSETEPRVVALKALLALHVETARMLADFAGTDLAGDIEHFYRPWRDSLDPMVQRIAEEPGIANELRRIRGLRRAT